MRQLRRIVLGTILIAKILALVGSLDCSPIATLKKSHLHLGHAIDKLRFRSVELSAPARSAVTQARSQVVLSVASGGSHFSTDLEDDSGETKARDVLSYYLLWSPGMLRLTALSVLFLAVLRVLVGPVVPWLHDVVLHETAVFLKPSLAPLDGVIRNVLLPLLSSACCSIQLIVNAIVGAGGCAGFNKRLGPLRPYFIAILFHLTLGSFRADSAAVARGFLVRWSLALMPELVHLWNVGLGRRLLLAKVAPTQSSTSSTNGVESMTATIQLTVPTMGCVACVNKIDSCLRTCAPPSSVEVAKSWLEVSGKGGRALIKASVSSKQEAGELAMSLVEAVRGAGFKSCTLDSVQTE